MRISNFTILFFIVYNSVYGQFENKVRNFSNEKEFPQRVVKTIHQDKNGYIWFGMGAGLTRYDGYQFYNYKYSSTDHKSIQDDDINKVYSDGSAELWLATRKGLVHYHPLTDNFELYNSKNTSLPNDFISDIVADKEGLLWLSTAYGLASFNPITKKITPHIFKGRAEKDNNVLSSISMDKNNVLWCGTKEHGLLFFDIKNNTYLSNYKPFPQTQLLVSCIVNDTKGNIWVGYTNGGLLKYNQSSKKSQSYNLENRSAESNDVLCILALDDVYVGTDGEGIMRYNSKTDIFESTSIGNFHSDKVSSIFCDKQGDFWVGYATGGVDLFTSTPTGFSATTFTSEEQLLTNDFVADVLKDRQNSIWIANGEGGLVTDNTKFNELFTNDLKGKEVISLFEDKVGNIYIGTYKSGLFVFLPNTQQLNHYEHQPNDKNTIIGNYIFDIDEDTEGNIWCISQGNGVSKIDTKTDSISNYIFELEDLPPGSCNWHFAIKTDLNGTVWIGSTEGLYNLDPSTGLYDCYRHDSHKVNSIVSNFVHDLIIDSTGQLWIATDRGLDLYNSKNQSFQHITTQLGLGNIPVYSLCEDFSRNMWLGTQQGLIRLNENTYHSFHLEDGLAGELFNFGAKCISPQGQVFFGGPKGLTSFYPDSLTIDTNSVEVKIQSIKVNNKAIAHLTYGQHLHLTHEQNSISISFLAIDFKQADKINYSYQLEGIDSDWIDSEKARKVSYNFLPHGEYIIKVRVSKTNGSWNELKEPITIIIAPPFWLTPIAYMGYLVLIILAFYFFRRFSIIEINKKNKLQMEQLEKEAIEQVYQSKIRFYTDVSHEIRTPLTLIIDPINRLVASNDEDIPAIKEKLLLVQRNTNKMLNLINQLLDFSKVDTGFETLNVRQTDLLKLIARISSLFEDRAHTNNIRFNTPAPSDSSMCWVDRDKIEKVISNLLSNAFKFTPTNGEISVVVSQSEKHTSIEVKDTGCGIEQDKMATVFNRYVHGSSETTLGSGIGLSLTKRLVELHHGTITVQSTSSGSLFKIQLQNGNQHFKKNEIYDVEPPKEVTTETMSSQISDNEKPHILLVEDEVDILNYISNVLVDKYNVVTAQNGQEGITLAQSIVPDIIVSDVMMPVIDGNTLAKTLKNDPLTNHIPIVLLTARSQVDQEKESLETGVDMYLTKPIDTHLLSLKLNNLLQTRANQQEKLQQQFFRKIDLPETSSTTKQDLLLKVKTVVEENFNNPNLSVDYLSSELGMSRTQLFRKFKAVINETPKAFIQSIRINRAKELLDNREKSISDIAYEVGFSDAKTFSRSFKNKYGESPSEWRNTD